ncbi:hypothetical protein HBI25_045340 [Parastagonospora nodorum]|nr:hypothetical protein HBH43_141800 [Parastagonospora nodorum]KAH4230565.1 hypothetical protein HBI06_085800 [Parastagonospora nodorum]KAH4245492.1 hypothetical protein HBI05_068930 [Parastagonospora nodorum]KAH5264348.1 hypothetical protein HBI71_087430 [Parastagonospora nodorum]KAH5562025.1 hypothetical protein HBI26_188470 [Parastagonospora nodorum]
MSSSSRSRSSSPSSQPDMPRIPDHIVVTFDGQTREIMRIVREDDEERRPRAARTNSGGRPRYYQREGREETD